MVYTSSGNMPYVQFESVGDFIPEPRCSTFAVGLQTEGSKMGGASGPVGLWTKGLRVTGAPACAKYLSVCSVEILGSLDRLDRVDRVCLNRLRVILIGREAIPFYR